MDFLSSYYLIIKALHIMSVISWMAGLLYLPRLFVYHAERIEAGGVEGHDYVVMEKKLYHFIMNKAMMATWFFAILLMLTPGVIGYSTDLWFYVKLVLVVGMTAFHVWLGRRQDDFENGRNTVRSRTFRMVNEVPAVLMIVIVFMVVVKPF